MLRLSELKAEAQRHYSAPLKWRDTRWGHSYADYDGETISVMTDPPAGNAHIVIIRGGVQSPLVDTPQLDGVTLAEAYNTAMQL